MADVPGSLRCTKRCPLGGVHTTECRGHIDSGGIPLKLLTSTAGRIHDDGLRKMRWNLLPLLLVLWAALATTALLPTPALAVSSSYCATGADCLSSVGYNSNFFRHQYTCAWPKESVEENPYDATEALYINSSGMS